MLTALNHRGMDKKSTTTRKVTAETLLDAERLKALWDSSYEERKRLNLHSQGAFGQEYDIGNQAAVGFFLNGKVPLSKKAAAGFAKGLGCHISDFSPRIAKEIAGLSAGTLYQPSPAPQANEGSPKAAHSAATTLNLAQALEVLGMALAADMPDDVRTDVRDAMIKLIDRKGLERDQRQVHQLLTEPAAAPQTKPRRAA